MQSQKKRINVKNLVSRQKHTKCSGEGENPHRRITRQIKELYIYKFIVRRCAASIAAVVLLNHMSYISTLLRKITIKICVQTYRAWRERSILFLRDDT